MAERRESIGPYQVLERLGAGGMGEVWLAYDERLDRQVALKRIRPDGGAEPARRERFRREARLAAGINHPGVVQVYDLLTAGDEDFLVLEHVRGQTLRQLLAGGPLPPRKAAALARDIALGLEAAHAQGVIHRDLKTENVLVTAAGQPKIADFGIARRLQDGDGLTRQGSILGTYRALSPEQARGEPVDPRSDLFALGILLYETLTGESPFLADGEVATLHRILHHRPAPVRELNAAVPPELSLLVEHLLQKDRHLRPRGAGEVARSLDEIARGLSDDDGSGGGETTEEIRTILPARSPTELPASPVTSPRQRASRRVLALALFVALGLAAAGGVAFLRRSSKPLYVAVLAPEGTGPAAAAGSSAPYFLAVRFGVARALASLEGLSVKSFAEVDAVGGGPVEVARAVAADEVLAPQLACGPALCTLVLQRLDGRDGAMLGSETVEMAADDYALAIAAIAHQVGNAYPERRPAATETARQPSSEDWRRFLEIRQRLDARQEPVEAVRRDLAALRQDSPTFLEAYLLEADVARRQFYNSRDPRDLAHGLDLARRARDLGPGEVQPLLTLFALEIDGGDLTAAAATLAEITRRLPPGDLQILDRQARLLLAQGNPEAAMDLLADVVARHPSWRLLTDLAQIEYRNGRLPQAREHLGMLLARHPANLDGLSLLARIELFHGDLGKSLALHRQLVQISARPADLANLGVVQMLLGRPAESAKTFERLAADQPDNPGFNLNLADSYSLSGRQEEARALYHKVVDLTEDDPASPAGLLTTRAQALAHLGQGRQAVAAVRRAQRLAPADGSVAFEASLVYAILGEHASAMDSAEAALAQGLEPRWFDLPWFAALREMPEFQALLRSPG